MFPWGDTPAEIPGPDAPAYAVGDAVYSGDCRGTVVSVDADTIAIVWSDGDGGAIIYPVEASYLRKAMPWEQSSLG